MITSDHIADKSQLELIEILVHDLKEENISQIHLFEPLVKVSLLGQEKRRVEAILQDLIQYCKEGVTANNSFTMFLSGYLNELGIGCPVDYTKAMAFYVEAMNRDNTNALVNLAFMYDRGQGGAVNVDAGFRLLMQAEKRRDNPAAMFLCAMANFSENTDATIEFLEEAIKLGDTRAMYNRALMYRRGQGEESGAANFPAAIALLEQAIKFGNPKAMINRAVMHQQGKGGDDVNIAEAARLYRRATELDETLGLERLNDSNEEIFKYHAAMHQHNFAEAANLMIHNFSLVKEFIEFDCKALVLNNPNNLQYVEAFLAQCSKMNFDKDRLNTLYVSVLTALDSCEKELGNVVGALTEIKKTYLPQINIVNLEHENVLGIVQMVIDTWYNLTASGEWTEDVANFTKDAAQILSKVMYRIKLLDKEKELGGFLKQIALILVKNLYGEDYTIDIRASVSACQIMLLIALNDNPVKPTVEKMNSLLDKTEEFIILKSTTSLQKLLSVDSGSRFFDQGSEHKKKRPLSDIHSDLNETQVKGKGVT